MQKRPGYTLTELLIVIMIAMLLMVVSLPMIKSVMEDARPREASRILNSTLFTAKSRAAYAGRLVGVEFIMQVVGDPNANPATYQCTQMMLCEVPMLYAGDATSSQATINLNTQDPPASPRVAGTKYTYRLYLQDYPITNIAMSAPAADNTTKTAYYLTDQQQIASDARNAGDEDVFEIRFDHRGPWYPCKRSQTTDQFTIDIVGNPPVGASSNPNSSLYRSTPFQIRRPPVRVGNPVELPRGTAIDMMFSGIGPQGEQFADTGALRIMFTPEGNVYSYTRLERRPMAKFEPVDYPVFGTAHFLVGVPQKVTGRQEVAMGPYVYTDATKSNLADGNALWVSIGRSSGVVTTNENNPLPVTTGDTSMASVRQAYVQQCRLYATSREQKGGR